ncbi:GNAT family N-acetyltransferase [Thiohalophilus sp.]|uniref:GNAT family N-acetyltransferase n=1 Tax=Thiohalophilus sp. TaxID=3028392 RepID=UPI00397586C6
MKPTDWTIETVSFDQARSAIESIRRRVFIEEQQVPEELEWDGQDEQATHLLAWVDGLPVATARMLPDGHIGRMAVLRAWRQRGIGMALLTVLLTLARKQALERVFLHAQLAAMDFYARAGFIETGNPFMDAGIPHKTMVLELDQID